MCGKYIDPTAAGAFLARKNTARLSADSHLKDFSNKRFTNDTATLVALLVVSDRKAEAQELASKAKREWDNAAFHAAIDTALNGHVPNPRP